MKDWKDKLRPEDFPVHTTDKEKRFRNIKSRIGALIGQETEISEKDIFITEFSPDDVNYFIKLLRENRPGDYTEENATVLENKLERAFNQWFGKHSEKCPYEPFFWALKITDGYLGSIMNNAHPVPWVVRLIGGTLLKYWDSDDAQHINILRNIITNWDWYQPVHVAIWMYGSLTETNDEKIDEELRTQWLYRAMYYPTAFEALLVRKKTARNIQELMSFVSRDIQNDRYGAVIPITGDMREKMKYYIQHSSREEQNIELTYYKDSLGGCSKKARIWYQEVFGEITNPDEIENLIKAWTPEAMADPCRRNKLEAELEKLFISINKQVISMGGRSGNKLFVSAIIDTAGRDFSFSTQFYVKDMMFTSAVCPEYEEFIVQKYHEADKEFTSDRDFVYGCAYCYISSPELLEKLVSVYHLRGTGNENAKYLFSETRKKYQSKFKDYIKRLVDSCIDNEALSVALISNCARIYDQKSAYLYPTSINRICDRFMESICGEGANSVRYANLLMDLYSSIANFKNRKTYYPNLQKILNTKSPLLEDARSRANQILTTVYSPI